MSEINEMKDKTNTKTLILVLLGLVTGGIYNILWVNKVTQVITDATKARLVDSTYIIWLCVCLGLSHVLSGTGEDALNVLSGMLIIATNVLYIVWAFKAKSILTAYALNEHRVDLRMNVFYTVFFNIFYINYCINDLPELQRKQQVLSGQTQPQQG